MQLRIHVNDEWLIPWKQYLSKLFSDTVKPILKVFSRNKF